LNSQPSRRPTFDPSRLKRTSFDVRFVLRRAIIFFDVSLLGADSRRAVRSSRRRCSFVRRCRGIVARRGFDRTTCFPAFVDENMSSGFSSNRPTTANADGGARGAWKSREDSRPSGAGKEARGGAPGLRRGGANILHDILLAPLRLEDPGAALLRRVEYARVVFFRQRVTTLALLRVDVPPPAVGAARIRFRFLVLRLWDNITNKSGDKQPCLESY